MILLLSGIFFFFFVNFNFGCTGSSLLVPLVLECGGYSLVAAHELLIEVASLASVAVAHGLSFPVACGILLDQALNLCTPHWPGNSCGVVVKNLPRTQETQVWSLGWEDPLEEKMATHSSILAWKIPWIEEPVGLQSVHGVAKTWTQLSTHTHTPSLAGGFLTTGPIGKS